MRGLFRNYERGAGRTGHSRPRRGRPEALRMKNFDYFRPATISDAIAAAAEPGAAYLASGTNLLDLMKGGIARPNRLVDVTRLPGLDRIDRLPDGSIRIGATSLCRDRRRQSAAAYAMWVFLRYRQRLQQARTGRGLRCP